MKHWYHLPSDYPYPYNERREEKRKKWGAGGEKEWGLALSRSTEQISHDCKVSFFRTSHRYYWQDCAYLFYQFNTHSRKANEEVGFPIMYYFWGIFNDFYACLSKHLKTGKSQLTTSGPVQISLRVENVWTRTRRAHNTPLITLESMWPNDISHPVQPSITWF